MPRRPKVNVKNISRKAVKSYGYVRPNPGVRAIAAINGTGSYRSARSEMSGLTPAQKRVRAKRAVSRTTRNSSMPRRIIRRNKYQAPRTYAGRRSVSFLVPRARGTGKRRVSFRAASGSPKKGPISVMATNGRRRPRRNSKRISRVRRVLRAPIRRVRRNKSKAAVTAGKRVVRNRRRKNSVRRKLSVLGKRRRVRRNKSKAAVTAGKRVVRNRRRKSSVRRKLSVRGKRRSPVRRSRVVRNRRSKSAVRRKLSVRGKRRSPVRRRRVARNRSRSGSAISRRFRRNGSAAMEWIQTGGFIAAGVISHKLFAGFLKNMLVSKDLNPEANANVDDQADGLIAPSGLGFLPASMVPYAGIISGGIAAVAGVYLVLKTVKDQKTRQLVAGGMVASFLHTLIVDLVKKSSPNFAAQISGLGASNANAVRLSAMYGVNGPTSIEPMYQQINGTGEYFSSGVNGLGSTPWAAAGMGEYFSSGVNGVGEYFSSGIQGLGEYGSNPDILQAAAGYGAVDIGDNSNHLDPSSDLDRALSIAEAAAGVGSLGPMQAAAGLGSTHVGRVGSSQTWIPGESDPSIWAGVRPVDQSQMQTAMIPAGSLQSGGGNGIFG